MYPNITQHSCEQHIHQWLQDKPHLLYFFKGFLSDYSGKGSLYLVGGLIRDLALNKSSNKDIDFMVDLSTENEITTLLLKLKKKKIIRFFQKVGKSFPVFKINIEGESQALDFALARVERSLGKGHDNFWIDAKNISAQSDGKRRDFTVNALFAKLSLNNKKLNIDFIDYFNGLRDLNTMTLKAVGNAKERIIEDPLRILRAIRFCHQKGFSLDSDLTKVISLKSKELLPELSHDRIQDELLKTMKSNFFESLNDYLKYDFFTICFPKLFWFPKDNYSYFSNLKINNIDLVYPLLLLPFLQLNSFSLKKVNFKEIETDLNLIHCPRQKKIKDCILGLIELIHKDDTNYPLAIEEKAMLREQSSNIFFLYHQFKDYFSWSNLSLGSLDKLPQKISGNTLIKWGIQPKKGFESLVFYIRQKQLEGTTELLSLKNIALNYKF
ncbi:MAG: hypothetical protein COB02_02185 [Candidatus Cloacimonadota bacterium]|nr:MAG: hypothetical protein COB02_02185 [Candidatus Cloacimonadota bacterium]